MATASFRVLEAIKIHPPQYGEIVGVVIDMAPPEETEASGGGAAGEGHRYLRSSSSAWRDRGSFFPRPPQTGSVQAEGERG